MKKRKKIPNMQRRRKEQIPASQKNVPESALNIDDAQMAEFMANAEAAFAESGEQTRYFIHDPMGLHSQQEPDGTWRHMIRDGLNSIRGVTDEALSILESREYDPFGNPSGNQGTPQTPFGFTGEMTDPNGLVYLRNRYYDPSLGVFPNLDPVEGTPQVPMSLNRYSYAQGNPVNLADPSGTIPQMIDSLQSTAISNPMRFHRLVESINSGCYGFGPSPGQHETGDCSCYRTFDAKYGGTSLYDECLAGNLPVCPPPSTPPSSSVTCPWDGILLLSSGVFDGGDKCRYTYDPNAAVRYARRWADDQNSLFDFFGGVGGDCTNFVSQALLYGGLPMTDAWYCANEPCGTKTDGYTSPWTGANFLEAHLRQQMGTSIPGVFPIPGPGSTDLSIENNVKALGASLGPIGVGDILYISGSRLHVALIVGWGPYVTNWDAALSQTLQPAYSDQNPVPYVVDHGPHTGIHAGPRPYYALSWAINQNDGTNIQFGDYRFVKTPGSMVLSLEEVQRRAPTFTKDELLNGSR